MPTNTATCTHCDRTFDLTDPRVSVTPTIGAGYAFCPTCGEIVLLDAAATKAARVARGESIVAQRPRQPPLPPTPPTIAPPPPREDA